MTSRPWVVRLYSSAMMQAGTPVRERRRAKIRPVRSLPRVQWRRVR